MPRPLLFLPLPLLLPYYMRHVTQSDATLSPPSTNMYMTARAQGGDLSVHPPVIRRVCGDNPSDRHGCRGDDRSTLLTWAAPYPRLICTTCVVCLLLLVAGPHLPDPPPKYAPAGQRNPGPGAGYWLLGPRDAHVGPRGEVTRLRAVHPAVLRQHCLSTDGYRQLPGWRAGARSVASRAPGPPLPARHRFGPPRHARLAQPPGGRAPGAQPGAGGGGRGRCRPQSHPRSRSQPTS